MSTNTLTPRGAARGASRDEAEGIGRKYIFRPYPAVRYHPDGRTVTVDDMDADLALGGEPWGKFPFPPAPKVVPPPPPTVADLERSLANSVAREHALQDEVDTLAKKLAAVEASALDQAARFAEERIALLLAREEPQPEAEPGSGPIKPKSNRR